MLNLIRRSRESLMIGDNVKVIILGFSEETGHVRIGIDAPKDIAVHRQEVYDKIKGAQGDQER